MLPEERLGCSIGISAYNEAANIGRLLERLLDQQLQTVRIDEIIVVASGCTDGTEAVVEAWLAKDKRIQLFTQATREGKASAINLYLANTNSPLIVLCSGDLLPSSDAIEALVSPYADPTVGMTSSRPVPINDRSYFMGFAAHLMWDLHHEMNLRHFKAGELVAFRKVFDELPPGTVTDEASIEPIIREAGLTFQYQPGAIVYNRGAETVRDFIVQRRRNHAGHLIIQEETGYAVSTMSARAILSCLAAQIDWRPKSLIWTGAVAVLEIYGRLLGTLDYRRQKQHVVWEMATTTKDLDVGTMSNDR